jgi:glycoside/pentoside/hexuronide:cation symporter, GPH family
MLGTMKKPVINSPGLDPMAKLGVREKLSYSLGDVASNVVFMPASSFFLFYLTTVAGIGAGIAGTILLVGQLLNGITDITMGAMMDKTSTRWGKMRPWILWTAPPLMLCFVLMFSVPAGLDETGRIIWTFIMYSLVMAVFFTASNVAYSALVSVMTANPKTRVVLSTFRFFAAIATTLIVSYITIPLVEGFGGGQQGWTATTAIYGLIGLVTLLTVFFGTKERVIEAREDERSDRQPLRVLLKQLFANKYFSIAAAMFLGFYLISGITSGVGIYYATDVLGDPSLFGTITLATLAPPLVGIAFMPALLARIGKRTAFLIGLGLQLIGSLIVVIDPSNFTIVLVGLLVRGFGSVPFAAGMVAMVADVVDYGEWKFGTRIDGLTYSAVSFGQKVGSGVGAAAVGWVLAAGGYQSLATSQPDSAVAAIQAAFIWLPVVLIVLLTVVVYFLDVEKYNPQIQAFLTGRRNDDTTDSAPTSTNP